MNNILNMREINSFSPWRTKFIVCIQQLGLKRESKNKRTISPWCIIINAFKNVLLRKSQEAKVVFKTTDAI